MTTADVYIFPSQVPVDERLREHCLHARSMRLALDLASDTTGIDFRTVLEHADPEALNDGRFRRPLVSLVSLRAYHEFLARQEAPPLCLTGMSLGCLTAATAAGWISLEDTVRTSHLMATLEYEHFAGTDYTSVFFLAGSYERVRAELERDGLADLLHPSAHISSTQFLAAARLRDLPSMRAACSRVGAVMQPLEHSLPGHCDLMTEVRTAFEGTWVAAGGMSSLSVPLIDLNSARPVTGAEQVRRLVIEQFTTTMDWQRVMRDLQSLSPDRVLVVEPAKFVVKSMELDPECGISPVVVPYAHD